MRVTERVHFRLMQMPCCGMLQCHVNSRLPNFCMECGKNIQAEVRQSILLSDTNAILKYEDGVK